MIIQQRHKERGARFRLARNKAGAVIEGQSFHRLQLVYEFTPRD